MDDVVRTCLSALKVPRNWSDKETQRDSFVLVQVFNPICPSLMECIEMTSCGKTAHHTQLLMHKSAFNPSVPPATGQKPGTLKSKLCSQGHHPGSLSSPLWAVMQLAVINTKKSTAVNPNHVQESISVTGSTCLSTRARLMAVLQQQCGHGNIN